jgi:phosphoglycolate phosphatase
MEMNMRFKYVLFDLDGTLTNPMEGITGCVQYALEKMGRPVPTKEELLPFIGPPLWQSFQMFCNMTEEESNQAVIYYRERFSTIGLFENEVYEGVDQMLAKLKRAGCVIALATSKPEIYARQILEKYELAQYFDCITGSELSGERTKKADVIWEVFRRLELAEIEQAQCVMVGDRLHDILGAKECHIPSIGLTMGYAQPGELEEAGADWICHTIEELENFLLH